MKQRLWKAGPRWLAAAGAVAALAAPASASAATVQVPAPFSAGDAFVSFAAQSGAPAGLAAAVGTAVGDFVWVDSNYNGVQDAGEPGLAGVTLSLTDTSNNPVTDANGTAVGTQTTDASGAYAFENLKPGAYIVHVDSSPLGFVPTLTGRGTATTDSSTAPATSATLAQGDQDLTLDFGFVRPVTVGDYVWNDLNGNGVQDRGEPGIRGVTLTLTDPSGNPVTDLSGNPVGPVVTDSNGTYHFGNLPPGTYVVHVDGGVPPDLVPTRPGGGPPDTDSSTDHETSEELPSGGQDPDIDFGFTLPVQVGDFVWIDTNHDGVQDPGEPGIPGVRLTLTDASGNPVTGPDGNPVGPQTTDANGAYEFTNLPPGTYIVHLDGSTLPSGLVPTLTGAGTAANDSETGSATSQTLAGGESDQTLDFGFFAQPVCVGDFVWFDENGNGVQDAGEPGIAGVTLTLTDAAGNPVTDMDGNPVGPTTTDADGHYGFCNLPPGTYVVHVQPPDGYKPTLPGQGTPESDSSTGTATSAALDPGDEDLTLDFGFVKPVCVGDFVWVDENGNGVQDAGEPGIAGVTLTLTDAAGNPVTDMDGNPVGPTTTDADGHYGFCDLPPGTYVVHVQPPAGYTPSPTGQGTPESDSSTDTATSRALAPGERDLTLDFGFVPVAAAPTPTATPTATPVASPSPTPGAPSQAPRLTLKKSVNHASVKPGAKVRYTLVARNVGGVAAASVQLCDQLPDHLTLAMSSAALKKAGGKLVKGDVCWSLGTVKAGAKVTRTLTVKVDRFAKAGRIVNHATVDRTKVVGVDARAQKAITVAKGKVKGERVSGGVTG